MNQISLFDGDKELKINKPIRLIELFAGYGSQHFALEYLGVKFESWKICEWAIKSIQAYKDAHFKNDNTNYSNNLTDEEIYKYLSSKQISMNYNEPLTEKQINRIGIEKARNIYNNIIATHNTVDIQKTHAKDLEIRDRDKYTYIMTYSFPCQDLSLAGKGAGMEKGSGTRSGMLWEVERILDECNGNLPQILLMENVPEVKGVKNIQHFAKWIEKLDSLGYTSKWQVLNAKDYGIPQNRERCFMISYLGNYYYDFPGKLELKNKLKDLLEDNVEEKYYLSDKMINYCLGTNQKESKFPRGDRFIQSLEQTNNKGIATTVTTNAGNRPIDNFIIDEENLKTKLCNNLIKSGKVKPYDVIKHSFTSQIMNGNKKCVEEHNMMPTMTTRCDCLGVCVKEPIACELRKDEGIRTFKDNVMGTLRTIDSCGDKHIVEIKGEKLPIVKNTENYIQWYKSGILDSDSRAFKDDKISETLTTNGKSKILEMSDLRIRKLTPKECFRLMGVKDKDFENIAVNQSNASLYHLAGDSIVINVLIEIFKKLL